MTIYTYFLNGSINKYIALCFSEGNDKRTFTIDNYGNLIFFSDILQDLKFMYDRYNLFKDIRIIYESGK